MKIMLMALAMLALAGVAFAEVQIETHLSCTGNCSWTEVTNNETTSAFSNESMEINSSTNGSNGTIFKKLAINATGAGTLNITNGTQEELVAVNADGQEVENSSGFFSWLSSFFGLFKWFS